MYRLLFSLFFLLASFSRVQAQEWVQQYPYPLLSELEGISVDPTGTAWAVGNNSGILHSDDFGQTWVIFDPPAADPIFRDVLVLPGSGGMQALIGGSDLHLTTDNGQSWSTTTFNDIYDFGNLQALDAQTLLAFAKKGMARSEDGGASWEELLYPADVSFGGPPSGFFINETEGWMVEYALESKLYHTTDGGQSWAQLGTQSFEFAHGIFFFDNQHGLLLDNDYMYETTDGGLSWTALNTMAFPPAKAMEIADDQVFVAVCSNGSVQYTEDAGATWAQVFPVSFTPSWTAVTSLNGDEFWIGGSYSTIVWTDDFISFTEQVPGLKAPFQSIDFLDDQWGMAVSSEGHFLRTYDGGAIWEDISPADFVNNGVGFRQVYVESASAIWASTYSGGQMYFSDDFGDSWQALGAAGGSNFKFVKVGPDEFFSIEYNGKFYHSTDGAMSWTLMEDLEGNYTDIFFHSPLDGWLAGYDGKLLHTTDGGQSWETVQAGTDPLQDYALIRFVDAQTGWAVPYLGNEIFKTTDGGQSWTEQSLPGGAYWQDLDFSDDQHIWLCGGVAGSGSILQSTDGGENWTITLNNAAEILRALSCPVPGEELAWAAGWAGQIAKWVVCSEEMPVLNAVEGPSAPCLGDTVQYTVDATAVDVFEWDFPGAWFLLGNENTAQVSVVVGEQSGDLIVTGANTCGDVVQITFPLDYSTIPPSPPLNFSNGVLSTDVQNGASYNWYLEGVLTATTAEPFYMPTVSGNWSLGIVAPSGCESELSEEIYVVVTALHEREINAPLLSPNPTEGLISLRHLPKGNEKFLELTDRYGRRIARRVLGAEESLEWMLPEDLPAGLYLLNLQVDGQPYAWRIVLTRP